MDSIAAGPAPMPSPRWRRIGRALWLTVASGGLLLFATLRTVRAVARLASSRAATARVIVVPGCGLNRGEVSRLFDARLQRALRLWRNDPDRVLLLSGGAAGEGLAEAAGGLAHLVDLGLPANANVLLETAATDTEQNLLLSRQRLRDAGIATDAVVVVSNRWHLARCAWLAQRHGIGWRVCAAERRWRPGIGSSLAMLREAISLLSYAGYDALHTDPRQLLGSRR